jgi:peptide/nickel transport system permease protein/oligopeptide transport system permease protein
MFAYLIRRILISIPLALGVVFVVTVSFDLIPGDPAALILGEFATPEAIAELRTSLGLDRPLLVRYVDYVGDILVGDLGTSIRDRRPVTVLLAETFPYTLQLSLAAITLVVIVGIPLGLLAASRPGSWVDNLIRVVSLAGLSMPVFWTGIVFMVLFSVYLRWLPVSGSGTWRHLVLPAVTLALPSIAVVARMTRSTVLEVLREDFVRTARAKGVSERALLYKHTLRNALIPVVTVMGLQMGQMLGGAVLTETVFAWPGVGRLTVTAIFNRDFVLMQGLVLVIALLYVSVNLLVDLSYGLIDPRVRYT